MSREDSEKLDKLPRVADAIKMMLLNSMHDALEKSPEYFGEFRCTVRFNGGHPSLINLESQQQLKID